MFGKPDKGPERPTTEPAAKPAPGASSTPAPAPVKDSGKPSVISADLKIVGNLQSGGDLQIDGTVEGDINSRSLTVGEDAKINGSLFADAIRVCGTVTGEVKAARVTIAKTAKVNGDIMYRTLSIEEGAVVEGHCRRLEDKPNTETKVSSIKPAQTGGAPGGGATPGAGGSQASMGGSKPGPR